MNYPSFNVDIDCKMRSFVINMTVIAVTLRKNQATTGVSLHTIHCFGISSLEFVYLFTHLFIYLFILHRLLDGGHDFQRNLLL